MSDQFDAFQKEIADELQRERMQKLWDQYKAYIVGAMVAIVVGVGGYNVLTAQRIAAEAARGDQFFSAVKQLEGGKQAEGLAALAAMGKASGGYPALAEFRVAGAHADAGRTAEAVAAYEAVSRQAGLDPLLTDFARLQTAMLKVDTADWTEMQNRLTELAKESNPWRHAARELLGMSAFKAGKTTEARSEFERLLGDRSTPAGISERVNMMMALLTQADMAKAQGQAEPKKN